MIAFLSDFVLNGVSGEMTTSFRVILYTVGILFVLSVCCVGQASARKKLPSWMEPPEIMFIKYRLNLGSWHQCSRTYFHDVVIPDLRLTDRVEFRLMCDHPVKKIDDGMRVCSDCNEVLEVTSHRD